jgi:hypothetical protein
VGATCRVSDVPQQAEASGAMRLGWISIGLGLTSVMGILFSKAGPAIELEGIRLVAFLSAVLIPRVLGPCVALGTVGAAFAEGATKRASITGSFLGAVGAALPWGLWYLVCCRS